jgi:arginine decarboxylase
MDVLQGRGRIAAINRFGKRYNIGLEVGSTPELVAAISFSTGNGIPIIPLQRLEQKPEVMASIADITCNSDGEITSFVRLNGRTKYLPLHDLHKDEDYLIGAYQEILGDMHNLFGDTNAVHVTFNKKTGYQIDTVINGDVTWESLKYAQYKGPEILKQVRDNLEKDVALRKITIEESCHFIELLNRTLLGYTYLGE